MAMLGAILVRDYTGSLKEEVERSDSGRVQMPVGI